jgi:hypothetical protein
VDKYDDTNNRNGNNIDNNSRLRSVISIEAGRDSKREFNGGEPDFDTWLSQQLRVSEPHVDNDGFCERVMSSLPVPRKRSERRASRFQYAAVVAASAIVVWQFPFDQVIAQAIQQSISLYSLVGLGILTSLVTMTGGILAVRR